MVAHTLLNTAHTVGLRWGARLSTDCGYNPGWCCSHPHCLRNDLKCVEWDVNPYTYLPTVLKLCQQCFTPTSLVSSIHGSLATCMKRESRESCVPMQAGLYGSCKIVAWAVVCTKKALSKFWTVEHCKQLSTVHNLKNVTTWHYLNGSITNIIWISALESGAV